VTSQPLFNLAFAGRRNYLPSDATVPGTQLSPTDGATKALITDSNTAKSKRIEAAAYSDTTDLDARLPTARNRTSLGRSNLSYLASRGGQDRTALFSFLICVLLPVAFAAVYYGFIASNQFVAEFRFTVKDAAPRTPAANNPLMSIIGGINGTNNADNYLVVDYLTSRQAVEELEKRISVTTLYSKPTIDWWGRYNPNQPIERFISYWQSAITTRYDQVTGIAFAQVRAYTPEDALLIANSLVALSEELVNGIANRTQNDAVRFAEREVQKSEKRLLETRAKLTEYRNRTGVIDPTTSVAASNATLVQTLRATLTQLETQQSALLRQQLDPTSPTLSVLNNQIRSTKEQLQKVESSILQDRDGVSLSRVMAEYEQLDLERQFAQSMVTSAMQALDQARASAASQHLYITPYVQPHLPQSATYPRRFFSVLVVAGIAFLIWVVVLLVGRSIRERFS
jgi:capsular polysaccharide transport system permease protein